VPRPYRTFACLCFLTLPACEIITGPGVDLPEEDLSLDPARLSVGYEIYYCGDWNRTYGRPGASSLFVDVFFSAGLEQARLDHPLAVHRYLVESVGGSIVRSFHAAGFRVWIARDSIPVLSGHNGVVIRSVPDPRRFDLRGFVFYGGPGVFGGADSAKVTQLGGSVVRNFENLGIVILHIPDRSLQQIREDSRVQYVDLVPDFLCAH
jgi:hypothetical protein